MAKIAIECVTHKACEEDMLTYIKSISDSEWPFFCSSGDLNLLFFFSMLLEARQMQSLTHIVA